MKDKFDKDLPGGEPGFPESACGTEEELEDKKPPTRAEKLKAMKRAPANKMLDAPEATK